MRFYLLAWRRSFDFSGCSSKQEFWWFFLVHALISLVCILVDVAMESWMDATYGILSFIPTLSAIARRLHDIGKSAYWGFVFLVPIAGPFWLAYLLAQPAPTHMTEEAPA